MLFRLCSALRIGRGDEHIRPAKVKLGQIAEDLISGVQYHRKGRRGSIVCIACTCISGLVRRISSDLASTCRLREQKNKISSRETMSLLRGYSTFSIRILLVYTNYRVHFCFFCTDSVICIIMQAVTMGVHSYHEWSEFLGCDYP